MVWLEFVALGYIQDEGFRFSTLGVRMLGLGSRGWDVALGFGI